MMPQSSSDTTSTNSLFFTGNYEKDPRPPLTTAFNCTMMMSTMMDMKMDMSKNDQSKWASVVFHQPVSGKAIYCARLIMASMNMDV